MRLVKTHPQAYKAREVNRFTVEKVIAKVNLNPTAGVRDAAVCGGNRGLPACRVRLHFEFEHFEHRSKWHHVPGHRLRNAGAMQWIGISKSSTCTFFAICPCPCEQGCSPVPHTPNAVVRGRLAP